MPLASGIRCAFSGSCAAPPAPVTHAVRAATIVLGFRPELAAYALTRVFGEAMISDISVFCGTRQATDTFVKNVAVSMRKLAADVDMCRAMGSRDRSLVTVEEWVAVWSRLVASVGEGGTVERALETLTTESSAAIVSATTVRLGDGHGIYGNRRVARQVIYIQQETNRTTKSGTSGTAVVLGCYAATSSCLTTSAGPMS